MALMAIKSIWFIMSLKYHTFELLETEYEGTDKDIFKESMNDNNDTNDDDDYQVVKNKDKENGKENAKDSGIDNDKK